ncbi:MAG: helix-turn-helix domain-containing protein [Alphaproteobacteria bacterium]|jgi:DNA-binding MarR family transcriptional regulator|nr:helix-turn-helix domain-containing protein [Alphaproteobacteria bacterium]
MTLSLNSNQALNLWRKAVVEGVRNEAPDLTARQMAVLLTVYLTSPPHTVRGLSAELGIAKPAVTRALDRLSALDLVRRRRDESDRRSIEVQRTVKGSVFLSEFADRVTRAAGASMPGPAPAAAPIGVRG